jgi:5-methyltetrahydrofolate--homocysteine methyltransferase
MTRQDQTSAQGTEQVDLAASQHESAKLSKRSQQLLEAANQRILVLDGAMGTAIQSRNLNADDFGGPELEGCNENLVLTRPDIIQEIHEEYLKAGCDIVETNTFGSTPLVLDEYGLGEKYYEITKKAVQLARAACDKYSTPEQPRFVAGSIGPTTKAISVTGGITFSELIENFYKQVTALIDGGADYLLIETAQDSRNIKAALIAVEKLEKERHEKYLVAISGTIETMGTMLAGQNVEALLASVLHRDLFYIGLNCATGPEFMTDHIRTLAQLSPFRVACVPNAGLPDEDGCYLETPDMVGKVLTQFMDQGWINFVGGCCGTHHGHVHTFSHIVKGKTPRKPIPLGKSLLSGIDFLEVTDEMRPLIVGERTNVIGSKKFREMIAAEKFEEAAEIARAQVKSGAHIIDICLSNPDRNEIEDTQKFLEKVIKVVKAPLMIDSTDEKVIELALTYCQGKSIINSINLEDGEERFEKVVPLARSFGAALVVGTIDEDPEKGMAVSRERKLAVAERSFELLTKKYGVDPHDIYFDPLVFPCATGDENYVGSAAETIEGVRLIKQKFPQCKTVLGVSNVSFGLPPAGREVLNSVFLHHCVQAGLDLAIVNSEKLERYASLPKEEIDLANNLLFNRGEDPVGKFAAHFRVAKVKTQINRQDIPLETRLGKNIIEGSKEGLIEDLELALKKYKPLEIINGPLMAGMDEVGKLFNDNKLIVAEVLQSAEVMKAAVAFLEGFMDKSGAANENAHRGKMLLATVKGDVHDIGKNLVDIILSNNGFKVINLGIKIPPEKLIEEARAHKPDFIGLSGLLVKSAQQMVTTVEDLSRAGISVPILVGGAALSRNFTEKKILPNYSGPVFYASDAMNGLDLANQIMDPEKYKTLKSENDQRKEWAQNLKSTEGKTQEEVAPQTRSQSVDVLDQPPQPPDFKRHVVRNAPLDIIWKYINPLMLYNRHLGVKAKTAKLLVEAESDPKLAKALELEDPKSFEIFQTVQEVKKEYKTQNVFEPTAVYQFFKARSHNNSLNLYDESQNLVKTFTFPRQKLSPQLCLADYVSPLQNTNNDNVALFVVTAGKKVREVSTRLKDQGQYLKSHILQALAIETAEAYAEYLHMVLRGMWGFPDSTTTTMMDRFQAKYRGKRYSFGYPACPRLEDQVGLFELLKPQEIGVQLTEGFMMEPEASVSALVFHHPQAQYFSVGMTADEANL